MSTLHPKLRDELFDVRKKATDSGDLRPLSELNQYYDTFRDRFGPDRLAAMDGEVLLSTMHDHGNRDSLVYWLEFKDDDEFPAIFGSIAGGSALKFGIYRRKETGVWMAGPPRNQRELDLDEAIAIARKHRDQLLAGAQVLAELAEGSGDDDYARLQAELNRVAPDVSNTAWGHKYFSLLFPAKLDDYHVEEYHRFHLIKLLQLPPHGDGRYVAAGRYVDIAGDLDMPLNHLTTVLNRRNGGPYNYWCVRVNYPTIQGWENHWESMREGAYAAIGWAKLGNLSHIEYKRDSLDALRRLMKEHYNDSRRLAAEVFRFVTHMHEGDLVLAYERDRLLGIGRISSGYVYDESVPAIPHRRQVEWLWQGDEKLPDDEVHSSSVCAITKPENRVFVETLIFNNGSSVIRPPETEKRRAVRFTGSIGRIQSVLERKKQVILYGPPGTGKTYWARIAAQNLAASAAYGKPFEELTEDQKLAITDGASDRAPLVRMCTFHPAYGYEDFLEGYRPTSVDGHLVFENRDGIFKSTCVDAAENPNLNYYLIIDEINRGDIPRIFGELLTVLEHDKRNQQVVLPLSGKPFAVPPNVYVVGTMNTADRSIALLDTALRRRFGFFELMPDSSLLGDTAIEESIALGPWLDALNQSILENIGRDARNLQIGHAYFLRDGKPVSDFSRFARVVQDDIIPLLEEYCYEDFAALTKILGKRLVDEQRQRVRHDLFDPARRDALLEALLAPFPDLATTPQFVEKLTETSEDSEGEEESPGAEPDEQDMPS